VIIWQRIKTKNDIFALSFVAYGTKINNYETNRLYIVTLHCYTLHLKYIRVGLVIDLTSL